MSTPALIYLSWGGTGRGACLREAMSRAYGEGRPLVYLAVLDDSGFGDLDESMLSIVSDELAWLLDAQVELSRTQVGADDLPVSIEVRAGSVSALVAEAVATIGPTDVLIGAPVPLAGHASIETLIDQIEAETAAKASVVTPAG